MSSIIVILGNEPELVILADSLNKLLCAGAAKVELYNNIANSTSPVDKLILVGHANVQEIGDYDVNSIHQITDHFSMNRPSSIYLAGCSTGDANQQTIPGKGFFAGLPLAQKIKSLRSMSDVYYTKSTLWRKGNGDIGLEDSLNQGVVNVTGANCFTKA